MPLDPSIILQGRNQVPDYGEVYGRALSLRSLRNQSKLQDAALAKTLRLRDLQKGAVKDGKFDPEAYAGALEAEGYADEALATRKGYGELAGQGAAKGKTEAETAKIKSDTEKQAHDLDVARITRGLQLLSAAKDPASYEQSLAQAMKEGLDVSHLPPTYNAEAVATITRQLMTAKERADAAVAQQNADTSRMGAVTGQGQLKVAQGNLQNAQDRLAFDKGTGKAPAGYRPSAADPTKLEFIPGGPADPVAAKRAAPTEDERKASGWLSQARFAYKNMLDAIQEDKNADNPGFIETYSPVEYFANASRSPSRQKFTQAASSFAEAALRAATGAGVTKEEAKQKAIELTPQLGDSDEVIKQKQDALLVYLDALESRAGRAATPDPHAPVQVSNPQEAMALPPGTVFITPDGRTKVR